MFDFGGLRIMVKVIKLEHNDVTKFSKEFDKRAKSGNVDKLFVRIADTAMENTIVEAEKRSLVYSGELKKAWRRNIEDTEKVNGSYSKTATNKAHNPRAEQAGYTPYYAKFIELGHKKVGWRKDTHAVPMLSGQAGAEENTLSKLPKIVDDEIKKFFGGLLD